MAEQKNKNGRVYPLDEVVPEVSRYQDEMIKEKRSLGELNHPTSVEVNPERSCHLITEMKQEGNVYIGKSKILSNPIGQIVRSLIMDGVKLGVSTRALGKVDNGRVSGFHLICTDVVHDPSVNTGKNGTQAFVNGIFEAKEWILQDNGLIVEAYDGFESSLSSLPKRGEHREEKIAAALFEFFEALKKF